MLPHSACNGGSLVSLVVFLLGLPLSNLETSPSLPGRPTTSARSRSASMRSRVVVCSQSMVRATMTSSDDAPDRPCRKSCGRDLPPWRERCAIFSLPTRICLAGSSLLPTGIPIMFS
ncbi:hypothetical protein B0T19DRAFT_39072 [Cercophora scortea]|uniref:Secreted protein n=1 Tax=Cercophora scortea TaxID=314031 RepID=A0AAE0MLE5_9PEZI|nr:hypothetical protein B0T19DRAFT_39072 [Cercophora scortea]